MVAYLYRKDDILRTNKRKTHTKNPHNQTNKQQQKRNESNNQLNILLPQI